MSAKVIELYYDFSSPNSYFAAFLTAVVMQQWNKEMFWGKDRLDFIEELLRETP